MREARPRLPIFISSLVINVPLSLQLYINLNQSGFVKFADCRNSDFE